ncbi:sialidase family protein [Actinophytocola sp.]|uniref:sialidase family protein n=1 Tax=Actinophytocola sp. TaxID=1872138 RepID=UPI003899F03B
MAADEGPVHPAGRQGPRRDRELRVHREARLLPDGTIVVPAYLAYVGERQGSIILQSTGGGRTWTQRGQIPAPVATNEVGWSFTTDNRLVAAVRTGENRVRAAVHGARGDRRGAAGSGDVPLAHGRRGALETGVGHEPRAGPVGLRPDGEFGTAGRQDGAGQQPAGQDETE